MITFLTSSSSRTSYKFLLAAELVALNGGKQDPTERVKFMLG